ncbi:MAG: hypothetical protein EZS28_029648 [Streblomastix strix]|uniref:Uncharacterized protein n=1 Tax=Streblomastix strix TaxID=222440 RepID=A0A5J4UVV2_9EUKA|nr:MAG: hypothetical protein EZS28_029648 [Streblomastix strix]
MNLKKFSDDEQAKVQIANILENKGNSENADKERMTALNKLCDVFSTITVEQLQDVADINYFNAMKKIVSGDNNEEINVALMILRKATLLIGDMVGEKYVKINNAYIKSELLAALISLYSHVSPNSKECLMFIIAGKGGITSSKQEIFKEIVPYFVNIIKKSAKRSLQEGALNDDELLELEEAIFVFRVLAKSDCMLFY